MTVYTRSKRG